jgi:hypothetical protein
MPSYRTSKPHLTPDEIARAFDRPDGENCPVILLPAELAGLLRMSVKTIYDWISHGRLDGSYRKRGKHILFWRDRVINLIMNGKDWQ